MESYQPIRDRFAEQLKLVVDYCLVLSVARGLWTVLSIVGAKLLGRTHIRLPVPGTRRTLRLRCASSDIKTYNQVFIRQEYDFSDLPHAERFRFDGSPGCGAPIGIVDCGANVGCTVVWFAERFPSAKIVAIEPDQANFELLAQNAAAYGNVRTLRAALWSSETQVAIVNPDAKPWAFRTEPIGADDTSKKPSIDAVTMASLLADLSSPELLIVKMDIEGAEYDVFSGNTSWIDAVDLLIIELHDFMLPWKGNSRPFFSAIHSRPMDYVSRGENLFCFQDRQTPRSGSRSE